MSFTELKKLHWLLSNGHFSVISERALVILYKSYAFIFGELLIVLVLILIVITYIESQYMTKNISAHCKKNLTL